MTIQSLNKKTIHIQINQISHAKKNTTIDVIGTIDI
jgi:hypothetical protein